MLLVSSGIWKGVSMVLQKKVLIERQAALLVTTPERARAFAVIIQCRIFGYSFCHCKVQFLWCTFQMHFGIGTRHFQKAILRMKFVLSVQFFIYHIVNIGVRKYVSTCVVIKIKISHLCRTRVVRVLIVLLLCCTCVALVAPASLVSGTSVVNQTKSIFTFKCINVYYKQNNVFVFFKCRHLFLCLQCNLLHHLMLFLLFYFVKQFSVPLDSFVT